MTRRRTKPPTPEEQAAFRLHMLSIIDDQLRAAIRSFVTMYAVEDQSKERMRERAREIVDEETSAI